jgi:hypothetical protein
MVGRYYDGPRGNDLPICPTCGKRHLTAHNGPACTGHVTTDRATYVKGQDRKPLPEPRACAQPPMVGLEVCRFHGGANPAAIEAGRQRVAEADARTYVERKLGAAGSPVTDPIATLCGLAGRAVAFMEALGSKVDAGDPQLAEIVVYGRSIKDAAGVVEAIIRMGIAERLAKVEEEQTAAIVKFIDGVLTDLGHNPRAPEVAGVVARRLELVS